VPFTWHSYRAESELHVGFRTTIQRDGDDSVKISTKRLAATAVVASLAFAACSGDDDDADEPATAEDTAAEDTAPETTTADETGEATGEMTGEEMPDMSDLSGSIFVSGSSTVEPISIAVGNAFADLAPGVAVTVEGPGTGDGFAKFCAGETDISDASRAISEEEIADCEAAGIEFIELTVAVDGLSVVTAAENTAIDCLSFVDLYALLGPDATGISNWADASTLADEYAATVTDLGAVHTPYPDAELTVTAPGEESGTFDSFVEIVIEEVGDALGAEEPNVRPDYTASPNDNVIIEGISANPTSLGWVGFAFVEENLDVVKPLQVDGGAGCVEPTPETIASGEFPIARDLFIYVNANKLEENPALGPFVDYYVNEGISTLVGAGEGQVPYVPLSNDAMAETASVWESRETGTREG
jgi:phosphate transport system substrate-binding protein